MNKRALMLTAATVALLSGQSHAATCDSNSTATLCEINTVIVTPIATSTVQTGGSDISLISPGGITVTQAGAALKIDSNNNVTNAVTINNKGTTGAIGVEILAAQAVTPATTPATYTNTIGSYDGILGTIDLSGAGTGKTGLLVDLPLGAATGTFNASTATFPGISVGTIKVVGDTSYGIHVMPGVTIQGPLIVGGPITVTASTTASTSSTSDTGIEIDGNLVGNLSVSALGGSVVATGQGSRGLVVLGNITGSIFNGGAIEAVGITTPSTTAANPEGGSAFVLAGSVSAGIYNSGPVSSGDGTTRALMVAQGTGPAVLISPTAGGITTPAPLEIGTYTADTSNPGYSFYNRGTINAAPNDADFGSVGMRVVGANGAPVTFDGLGILNTGSIAASAKTDAKGSNGTATTALWIGDYVTVPTLNNSNSAGSGSGQIQASVSGVMPGQAIGILIDADANGNGTLTSLINSGTIAAIAQTSDLTISGMTAVAIWDKSGTLNSIVNSGTISAQSTTLNNNAQIHIAANLSANTSGVNFMNTGTVIGDVFFGTGNDHLTVSGTNASVTGNVDFHGGHDFLTVGDTDIVNGALLEHGGGYVDITVGNGTGTGTLAVNNTNFAGNTNYDNGTLEVGTLSVKNGATIGLSLSQGFNQSASASNPAVVSANNAPLGSGSITLDSAAILDVSFGSFVSTPTTGEAAKFVLFDTPDGSLHILNPTAIETSVTSSIPFLFTGSVCGYNLAGFTACSGSQSDSQLVLSLTSKTADQLGLTGFAKTMFPMANAALANDNLLGSAVIEASNGLTGTQAEQTTKGDAIYQSIYTQFAPEVTGASRALAISLTDSATSAVGARQRALRMYAGKSGSMSLWGQEFVQRLNNSTNLPDGYRDSGFGFALGADGGSASEGHYGGALTFFSGDITEQLPAQVKTSSEWLLGTGYSDWRGKGGFFFDSQATVGYGSLTGKRHLTVDNVLGSPILLRTATNKRASLLAAAGFSTGEILNWGTNVLTPQFSLDALTLRENGYTEAGGGNGFDLKVDPYYAKSLRAYLGVDARKDIDFGDFFLQPEARLGYRYDVVGDPVKLTAAFAGQPSAGVAAGSQFSLTGPDPARGTMVAGAGLAATTGAWSLGLNYDYLSGGGSSAMAGTLTLLGRI